MLQIKNIRNYISYKKLSGCLSLTSPEVELPGREYSAFQGYTEDCIKYPWVSPMYDCPHSVWYSVCSRHLFGLGTNSVYQRIDLFCCQQRWSLLIFLGCGYQYWELQKQLVHNSSYSLWLHLLYYGVSSDLFHYDFAWPSKRLPLHLAAQLHESASFTFPDGSFQIPPRYQWKCKCSSFKWCAFRNF